MSSYDLKINIVLFCRNICFTFSNSVDPGEMQHYAAFHSLQKYSFRGCLNTKGFFCSGIQFYLLLSPYLCFISLLYLDLYVLGDNALIS